MEEEISIELKINKEERDKSMVDNKQKKLERTKILVKVSPSTQESQEISEMTFESESMSLVLKLGQGTLVS